MQIVRHAKQSVYANPIDNTIVGGDDWNADHDFLGPFIAFAAQYDFTTGGALTGGNYNGDGWTGGFVRTGTGQYRCPVPNTFSGGFFMPRAVDGSGVHHDVDWEEIYDSGSYVQLTVKTRSGTVVDLTSGKLSVIAVEWGL